jgi:hypothetical protein
MTSYAQSLNVVVLCDPSTGLALAGEVLSGIVTPIVMRESGVL